jgi:hypothetical protein
MTYPPQQPGSGGWEQPANAPQQPAQGGWEQPANTPQQPATGGWEQPVTPAQPGVGGWEQPVNTPQQPGWQGGQPSGWPQQAGGEQAPPPPPPPDWGGAEFGHATWTQEPGGFADVQPPKKNNTPLIITIVVAVIVVLAGGGTGLYLFLNRGPGDPTAFANSVVTDVNQHNFAPIQNELCQQHAATLHAQLSQLQAYPKFNLTIGKVTTTDQGQQASAEVSGSYSFEGASHPVSQQMVLVVEKGSWKVCELNQ